MVVSMTGFGRSVKSIDNAKVTVEMKSVNHRYNECYIRMPRQLLKMEDKLKKSINQNIKRGKIDVYISIEGNVLVHRKIKVDWDLLNDYTQAIQEIQEKLSISTSIQLSDILEKDEVLVIQEVEEENSEIECLVVEATKEAVQNLYIMRKLEGDALYQDLCTYISSFTAILGKVRNLAPTVITQYKEKLESKLQELTNGTVDEGRILSEVALFAEKVDIAEEISRLHHHIKQFSDTVKSEEPIGRKLDFILQEMNREVNTMGSKSNDGGLSALVVDSKAIIEKMREQVQNVE
ncbi:YicC/YloC family endoribonuclease [Bacillus sp. 2205SS5-2]|uniref:YicC/YloC family endoribonuclease n=1 Tax=Bacillus sp. 2205SS5-2 TaxID=3109031 RepID=UPI00300726B2